MKNLKLALIAFVVVGFYVSSNAQDAAELSQEYSAENRMSGGLNQVRRDTAFDAAGNVVDENGNVIHQVNSTGYYNDEEANDGIESESSAL